MSAKELMKVVSLCKMGSKHKGVPIHLKLRMYKSGKIIENIP